MSHIPAKVAALLMVNDRVAGVRTQRVVQERLTVGEFNAWEVCRQAVGASMNRSVALVELQVAGMRRSTCRIQNGD